MTKEKFIKQQSVYNDMEIYTSGFPNYDGLTKAEKRVLLLPLVEAIRDFYKDPENRSKFEIWKVEYLKQSPNESPADEQGFCINLFIQYLLRCNCYFLCKVVSFDNKFDCDTIRRTKRVHSSRRYL